MPGDRNKTVSPSMRCGLPQCASAQFAPTPASTTSGTEIFTAGSCAPSMIPRIASIGLKTRIKMAIGRRTHKALARHVVSYGSMNGEQWC